MERKVVGVSAAGRPVGADSPRARWSDEACDRVRAAADAGRTIAEAARAEGMPPSTARDIIRGHRRAVLPVRWVVVGSDGRRRTLYE